MIGLEPSALRHWTVAFALPFLALLPATAAMGATLPAMERFVFPLATDGRCIGAIYAANTLGAVAGILLSAFVIVPALGLRESVLLFASINFLCGSAAFALGNQRGQLACSAGFSLSPAALSISERRLGVTIFCTGLLGIGYETAGIRVLSQVLENTVYTFAAALSIFSIGYWPWRRPLSACRPAVCFSASAHGFALRTLVGRGPRPGGIIAGAANLRGLPKDAGRQPIGRAWR